MCGIPRYMSRTPGIPYHTISTMSSECSNNMSVSVNIQSQPLLSWCRVYIFIYTWLLSSTSINQCERFPGPVFGMLTYIRCRLPTAKGPECSRGVYFIFFNADGDSLYTTNQRHSQTKPYPSPCFTSARPSSVKECGGLDILPRVILSIHTPRPLR